ncbi:L-ascorbate peroxidase [Klebsormidium nitens]|uniref:L-ascorbate peroxidase n=1 Tax=Klebsormidium nitens TaxID=105231 RepID=A0A1Y1ICZ7_KLENI|nr:L-ascorbate peroxidase [Klebsormidium nitens]|eukprot:GAQ88790.1 L-ascorbate peroxidase [Klebsormidium nitens]
MCAPSSSLREGLSGPDRLDLRAELLPFANLLRRHSLRRPVCYTRCGGCGQIKAVGRSRDVEPRGLSEPKVVAGEIRDHPGESQPDKLEQGRVPPISRRAALLGAVSAATLWTAADRASCAPIDLANPALDVLKQEIRKAVTLAKAPGVLRLVFHDGFTFNPSTQTGGPNGSIIFELDRPESEGLKRALRPLEKVKATLGDNVSWADLIVVAGAEAVAMTGGPVIPVRLGRRDQGAADPEDQMPPETLDAATLKSFFHSRNYSTQEMIALSGAHTLGGKGFGDPTTFDNSYYKILLNKPWETDTAMTKMIGLKTDRALPDDEECRKWVITYAEDQNRFFLDFASAYEKLVTQGVTWKS